VAGLLLPVPSYSGLASWQTHINRGTPSSEPGTDLYVPIGTHIRAPADGYIWGSGESIAPATGRWVGINFDNGMSFRSMHHSRNRITSGRVSRGDVIAFSGASGYGEEDWSWNVAETGGAHVHITLWPTHDHRYGYQSYGVPYTVDFMNYVDGALAGDGSSLFEGDELNDEQAGMLKAINDAIMKPYGSELQAIINILRGEIRPVVEAIQAGGILFPGQPYYAFPAIANAVAGVEVAPVDVDENALAAVLAPLLTANVGALSDEDVSRVAKAAADEQDRRTRERLS